MSACASVPSCPSSVIEFGALSGWQPAAARCSESGLGTVARAAVGPAVRLRLAREQAAALPLHIPALTNMVRQIAGRCHPSRLMIDLAELASGPFYQAVACLCAVLRRILGRAIPIVLVNVDPAVAWSLESGYLAQGVSVVPIRRHPHRGEAAQTADAAEEASCAWCACGRCIDLGARTAEQELVVCGVCGTRFRIESTHRPDHLSGAVGSAGHRLAMVRPGTSPGRAA